MIPLSRVGEGQRVEIHAIDVGRELSRRLKNMGLSSGDIVRVIQNAHGPVILAKGHLRLALGRGMSSKIFVRHLREDKTT